MRTILACGCGLVVGLFVMQPTTAQSPTVPFAIGDTILFRYDERGVGQKCKATAIVGDYMRCQDDDSKWWNLRAIRLIDVSK